MRVASYIGFFVMIGVAINAFSRDAWWATLLQLIGALAIGWFSLGLFQRAAVRAVRRSITGGMTDADLEMLRDVGSGAARREAERRALSED